MAAFQMRKPAEIGTKAAFPGFIEPELAKSAADRQSAGCTRSKCDGYRVQIHLKDAAVKVFTLLAEIEYRGKCATVLQASRTSPANAKTQATGQISAAATEADHFMECPGCGEWFDRAPCQHLVGFKHKPWLEDPERTLSGGHALRPLGE